MTDHLPVNSRSGVSRLYIGKSTLLKVFLLVGIAAVSAFFIWFSFRLIDELEENTRQQVARYAALWEFAINQSGAGAELQFIFDEIIVKATFPIIVLDRGGQPVQWRNIDRITPDQTDDRSLESLRRMAEKMRSSGRVFEIGYAGETINYLCYGDPAIIRQLEIMPFIQIGVVVAFLLVGLIGFHNIRRSEERLIWVGMAKETAHQLGTPITSLLGWLELLDPNNRAELTTGEQENLLRDTRSNMAIDVQRLQRVANRFGQIGSVPDLKPGDINQLVAESVAYYQRRLPFEGKGIDLQSDLGSIPEVNVNPELFTWVLENLIKNALQAVDPKSGRIQLATSIHPDRAMVRITVSDDGQGIPPAAARKIFRPGFTTKTRGWGLGLTLVRRIIEEYHGGRITLVRSRPGDTVFEILLPTATTS